MSRWIAALGAWSSILVGAAAAASGPDLVIDKAQSLLVAGGCEAGDALAMGRIVLKNTGDAVAAAPAGLLSRFDDAMVAVYSPRHLDMTNRALAVAPLAPGADATARIELAKGVVKEGRFGASASLPTDQISPVERAPAATRTLKLEALVNPDDLTDGERKLVQRALQKLGYYRGRIDGVIGAGGKRAIVLLQRSMNEPSTGVLTVGQMLELDNRSDMRLPLGPDAYDGEAQPVALAAAKPVDKPNIHEVTLYALADPFNLVQETNERNNLEVFTVKIECKD